MRQLDDQVLVSGQLTPDDLADLKRGGVTMIVNNRPDGEEPGQPLAADIERAAQAAGLDYRFVPISRGIGPADVEAMTQAFDACDEGKLLAFCRSGVRSALVWALARSREGVAIDEIQRRATAAGVDLTPVAHLL